MKHGRLLARYGVLAAGLVVLTGLSCELLGLRWDVDWEKEYQASPDCYTLATDMTGAPDGGVVIVGTTDDWGAASGDAFVIRLDNKGKEMSRKLLGGPGADALACVRPVSTGGYVACGIAGAGGWLVRLDETGDTLWTRNIGGHTVVDCRAVTPTSDGGFAVACAVSDTPHFCDSMLLVKSDASGAELWRTQTLAGDGPTSLYQQPDNGYLLSAEWPSLLRFDPNGETLWTRQSSIAGHMTPAPGSGFYGVTTRVSPDSADVVTARLDQEGETLWTRLYCRDSMVMPLNVAASADGGCVVFCRSGDWWDTRAKPRALAIKYSPDGALEWDHVLCEKRSNCRAGTTHPDGWVTAAVQNDPPGGPYCLDIIRTRP